ncbi:MAG: hypothetical protein LBN00_04555 [Oscillospiraceae bacterium]|jgi:hypothetical protein|nr:hypothetical protein [Oscillospiraceae bacterium]
MPKNKNYKPEDRTPPQKKPLHQKTAAEMDEEYAKAKKKLKLVAPICIVVIIVAFIFTKRPVPQELILPEHTFAAFYNAQTNETVFVADGSIIQTIDGNAEIVYTELDGSLAYARDRDTSESYYAVTPTGVKPTDGTDMQTERDYSGWLAGIEDINESFPLVTNADGTQVLVQTEFGAYICQAGAEPVPIGGDGLNYPYNFADNNEKRGETVVYRGTSLFEIAYINENNGKFALYGVGADGTSSRYGSLSDVPLLMRSNNGSAYYVKDSTIYLMQNSATEVGNNALDSDIVPESVCLDAVRKRLYFINAAGELRTLKGKSSSRVVDFNVTEVTPARDKGVYYLTSGGGFYVYDGKTSKLLAENVTDFTVLPNMTLFTDSDGGAWAMPPDRTIQTFVCFTDSRLPA